MKTPNFKPGTATKRGPGRPPLEESAKIQEARKVAQEAKRAESAEPQIATRQREAEYEMIPHGEEGRCGVLLACYHHKYF